MTQFLANKNILVGITGSIAAYKSADLVRRLREAGAIVRCAMTENAKRFITPLTMQAVSGNPVHDDLFDLNAEAAMGHIELARWADLILIAPATADFMARMAEGHADDLLTAVCLASRARVAIAPAMNQGMWHHTLTQQNLQALQNKNLTILGPASGSQACGEIGLGRMLEPAEIIEQVSALFATGALAGRKVVVTAGPTHEAIDPVRYIANYSSGKMGFALAQAAHEAGAQVVLISGPVQLPLPLHMKTISVTSAAQMYEAVMQNINDCDIFIGVAAVADYKPQSVSPQKLHKTEEHMTLPLERNVDIITAVANLPNKPYVIGFAAETENVIEQARAKRLRKKMDMIIANPVGHDCGMGTDENEVTVITETDEVVIPLQSKQKLGRALIELITRNESSLDAFFASGKQCLNEVSLPGRKKRVQATK